jgi:hypothetical protein
MLQFLLYRNVIEKETEKILKYTDLITEIQRMWNVKAKVIPVITGVTGTILKAQSQGTKNTAILGHCTHTSENTNVKSTQHISWAKQHYM